MKYLNLILALIELIFLHRLLLKVVMIYRERLMGKV